MRALKASATSPIAPWAAPSVGRRTEKSPCLAARRASRKAWRLSSACSKESLLRGRFGEAYGGCAVFSCRWISMFISLVACRPWSISLAVSADCGRSLLRWVRHRIWWASWASGVPAVSTRRGPIGGRTAGGRSPPRHLQSFRGAGMGQCTSGNAGRQVPPAALARRGNFSVRAIAAVGYGDELSEAGVAEREGFEPSVEFPLHTLSKRAPSTTRTSLQRAITCQAHIDWDEVNLLRLPSPRSLTGFPV